MGVVTTTSSLCCIQLQRSLDAMLPNTAPSNFPYDGGLLAALKDSRNVGQFTMEDPRLRGKGRPQAANACKLELVYEAPFCADAVDGCLDICDTLPAQGDSRQYLSVEIDRQKSVGGTFDEYEFACLCESPQERLAKRVQQGAMQLKKTMVEDLSELMYAQVGSYSNGNASNAALTTEDLKLLNPGGYSNPMGLAKLVNEHRIQRCKENPFIVGGLPLENWQRARSVGGLNGNHPVTPGDQSFGASVFVDLDFDFALQASEADTLNRAISWCPGGFQLLEWFENEGYMEKTHEHYTFTTLMIDGLKYDFYLRYQECGRIWSWVLCKSYDLFCLAEALYAPCIVGNHKLGWTLDCGNFDCVDYYVS